MNIENLKGKPIVSLSDGARVASIAEALIDSAQFRVVGFLLEGKPGKGFLPLAAVRGFGDDAFTIETAEPIKWSTGHLPPEEGTSAGDIVGLSVVDATGTNVGSVHDVVFNPTDGSIQSFDIRSGGVFGLGAHGHLVPPASVRGIGKSLMTVESIVADPLPS